ncbi:MAG: helix-turn-helix transcriptional regulator [Armatimonadetes bacterium]|nr:helix-turn-helix transcriptional regulator [Armatimonadota bacterium]
MKKPPGATENAVEILRRRHYSRPERRKELEAERRNAEISRELYTLRIQAGWTQRELARRVGTTPSVISRLEDEGYEGHSLTLLRRVAHALGMSIKVEFVPEEDRDLQPA